MPIKNGKDIALKLGVEGILLLSSVGFLALTNFVYIPAQIYFNNQDTVQAGFAALLGLSLGACALAAGAAALAALTFSKDVRRIASVLFATLAVFSFVLGSILTPMTVDLGLVDGGDADLFVNPVYFLLDAVFLGGLFALIFFQYSRLHSFLVNMFVMGGIFILLYAAYGAITEGRSNEASETHVSDFSAEDFYALSPEENVILILLDSFDSRFLDALLLEDPSLNQALDGFTFFHDAASVSPTTTGAMPSIHSGRMIYEDRPLDDSYEELLHKGSFLSTAPEKAGVMLLNPKRDICPVDVVCGRTANLLQNTKASPLAKWRVLVFIAVFRSAPYIVKPALYAAPEWYLALASVSEDADVLDALGDNASTSATRPQVRFIHLLHTHTPYNREFDCSVIAPRNSSPHIALNTVRCAMNGVVRFIDDLKAKGLYDQTRILIFADHGAVAFDSKLVSTISAREIDVAGDGRFYLPQQASFLLKNETKNDPRSSHPVFLVKPKGARGPLIHNSSNAVSLLDVSATACAETDICSAPYGYNAFEAPSSSERTRLFFDYDMRTLQGTFRTEIPVSEVTKRMPINSSLAPSKQEGRYELVEEFSFSRSGLIPGFSFPERWGRWSADERAGFDLCFKEIPRTPRELVLKARAYLPEPGQRQHIKASVNGRTVLNDIYAYDNPQDRGPLTWRFTLEPEDFDAKGCAAIAFEAPDAAPPPSSWREADRRRIGFGLVSMQFGDSKNSDAAANRNVQ